MHLPQAMLTKAIGAAFRQAMQMGMEWTIEVPCRQMLQIQAALSTPDDSRKSKTRFLPCCWSASTALYPHILVPFARYPNAKKR